MTKNEYLNELKNSLSPLSETEKLDIIADFEEHFATALSMGKSESEICRDLGNPKETARQYIGGAELKEHVALALPKTDKNEKEEKKAPQGDQYKASNYLVGYIFAVIFAVFVYIACVPTALAGLICVVVGFSLFPILSWQINWLIISAGVMLAAFSVLFMLLSTWLCQSLNKNYRKYNTEVK